MSTTNPYAAPSDKQEQVVVTPAQSSRNRTQEKLMGLVFIGIGGALLWTLGTSTIGLSAGVSAFTSGALLISGKLGGKAEAPQDESV